MKKLLVIISALVWACDQEEPKPIVIDPFVGAWEFQNGTGIHPFEIRFTVNPISTGGYTFTNINIEHPDIPEGEVLDNRIEIYDQFAAMDGFGEIKIFGHGNSDTYWIILILTYNSITNGGSELRVRELQIHAINEAPATLEGLKFEKVTP